jgi:ribosomal protein S18 acetylase RimI-like enzyme
MSIQPITFTSNQEALAFLSLQMASFTVEALLIGYRPIPPVLDTIPSLMESKEVFVGYYVEENLHKELVGAISYDQQGEVVTIARLVVQPHYFRRGIASALMNEVIRVCKQQGIEHLCVTAAADNTPAISLYTRFEFTQKDSNVYEGIRLSTLYRKVNL